MKSGHNAATGKQVWNTPAPGVAARTAGTTATLLSRSLAFHALDLLVAQGLLHVAKQTFQVLVPLLVSGQGRPQLGCLRSPFVALAATLPVIQVGVRSRD